MNNFSPLIECGRPLPARHPLSLPFFSSDRLFRWTAFCRSLLSPPLSPVFLRPFCDQRGPSTPFGSFPPPPFSPSTRSILSLLSPQTPPLSLKFFLPLFYAREGKLFFPPARIRFFPDRTVASFTHSSFHYAAHPLLYSPHGILSFFRTMAFLSSFFFFLDKTLPHPPGGRQFLL